MATLQTFAKMIVELQELDGLTFATPHDKWRHTYAVGQELDYARDRARVTRSDWEVHGRRGDRHDYDERHMLMVIEIMASHYNQEDTRHGEKMRELGLHEDLLFSGFRAIKDQEALLTASEGEVGSPRYIPIIRERGR